REHAGRVGHGGAQDARGEHGLEPQALSVPLSGGLADRIPYQSAGCAEYRDLTAEKLVVSASHWLGG
nr:hypothetical protein [Tanacetum cinerariifolium]